LVPVLRQNGLPVPGTVLLDGAPVRSTTGTFYLEFRENGRRIQRPVGTSPREAKDAWNLQCNPGDESDRITDDDDARPESTTLAVAFRRFLEEVKGSKEEATHLAYKRDLKWVEPKLGPKLVGQITRHDILRVMGEGRRGNPELHRPCVPSSF
jgi:hypothetical protein